MATFGFPSDSFAQSEIHAQQESAPSAPIAPTADSGPSAPPLSVPHHQAADWEAPAVTVLPVREAA